MTEISSAWQMAAGVSLVSLAGSLVIGVGKAEVEYCRVTGLLSIVIATGTSTVGSK